MEGMVSWMLEVEEYGEPSLPSASTDLRLDSSKQIEKEAHREWAELLLDLMNV
jgi:hypothetical protein